MEWKNIYFKLIVVEDLKNSKNKLSENYFKYMIDMIVQNTQIKPNFHHLN